MSKKSKKTQPLQVPQKSVSATGISKRGWKVIGAGIGILAVGFYLLTWTDPMGRNWASNLSPFVILGGYAVIAIGIILPERHSISAT